MRLTKIKSKKKLTKTMIYHAKKYFFLSLFLLFSFSIFSQNIEWEVSLGGSNWDRATSLQATNDGGYIVAGYSKSDNGDVSGNNGGTDYWVVKLDGSGSIEWEKNYGGSTDDEAQSVQQTNDGGYIVVGRSRSDDGDVSGNYGNDDIWVVKLDISGNIEWEGNYGGVQSELAYSVQQSDDGGYILVGESFLADGDVSGNNGNSDFWVVKLDSSGIIEWEENYGGSGKEIAHSVQQTDDGGYIVAGYSKSDDGDVSGHYGDQYTEDYWVLKIDSSGSIDWEGNYGGTKTDEAHSIQQTNDGGYIVAGHSRSDDGDVSGILGIDYWLVKLDTSGSIEWEKTYGGSDNDEAKSVKQTLDGGYIVAGRTNSKDGDVTGNYYGSGDYWVLKLDGSGNIEWEKNYGANANDVAYSILQNNDGSYIVAGHSYFSSTSEGDVSSNNGTYDYWVVKLSGSNMGISGYDRQHKINIYPNPTSGKANIQMDDIQTDKLEIKLSNISGQVVLRQTKDFATNFAIDFNGSAGIYFLEIKTDNDNKFVQRIVKK